MIFRSPVQHRRTPGGHGPANWFNNGPIPTGPLFTNQLDDLFVIEVEKSFRSRWIPPSRSRLTPPVLGGSPDGMKLGIR